MKKTKTKIFVLLAFNARIRLLDSPTNLTSFSILKTLSSLKALKAVKYWDPITKNDRYLGIVERRSITPKKLKIYFDGFFIQMILKIYSMVKIMVTTHSEIFRKLWYFSSNLGMLSSITTMILYTIMTSRPRSKILPAGVWVP